MVDPSAHQSEVKVSNTITYTRGGGEWQKKSFLRLFSGSSTVVEPSAHQLEVKGSNTITCTRDRGQKIAGKSFERLFSVSSTVVEPSAHHP